MLGYSVCVLTNAPIEGETKKVRLEAILAYWFGGGCSWLFALLKEGKVQESNLNGGYPNLYTGVAKDIVPVLMDLPELQDGDAAERNRIMSLGCGVEKTVHRDRIAACYPDRVLTLELWDQS